MHPRTTYFTGTIPRVEQAVDVLLALVLVGVAAWLAGRAASRGVPPGERRWAALTGALALAALTLRLALFPPDFVHANFHGPELVDEMLAAPAPPTNRAGFGQATFLFLGAAAHAFGMRFETVAWTNAVVGVGSLVVLGALAARWTGRAACAPLAVAVAALQPALARIACSEDAHGLGGFFGLVALLAMDVYAAGRNRLALVASVAAAALMMDSRQTYYVWAPCIVAMGVARAGWRLLRRPELVAATLAIATALGLRLAATFVNEPAQVAILPAALASPRLVLAVLEHHPLFDVPRFALGTLPLEILGIVAMRAPMRRAYVLLLGATFLVTAPFGFPAAGVECSFRTPVLLLAVVAAAVGAERLWRARLPGRIALGAALAAPLVLPTWRALREPTPTVREYRFVRDVAAPALGPAFTLAELRPVDPMPSYRLADAALASSRARRVDVAALTAADLARGPVYFLAGLQCRARSGLELLGITRKVETLGIAQLRDMALPSFEHRVPGASPPPATLRDECARLLANAEPVGPELVVDDPGDENPFIFYGDAPVHVRFWRLRGPAGAVE